MIRKEFELARTLTDEACQRRVVLKFIEFAKDAMLCNVSTDRGIIVGVDLFGLLCSSEIFQALSVVEDDRLYFIGPNFCQILPSGESTLEVKKNEAVTYDYSVQL